MPLLLLFTAFVGGLFYYELVVKHPSAPPAPSTPPSPNVPTYTAGGLTFLNPTLSGLVLQALAMLPGVSSAQTDSTGATFFVTTPSTSLGDTPMGTSLSAAINAGAIVLLVGPWASWAASGASGLPPTQPQAMTTSLPSQVDVKAQALRLQATAGGGVVLGPQASTLGIA